MNSYYEVRSSYGDGGYFTTLSKAKEQAYLLCAEAPYYSTKHCANVVKEGKVLYRVCREKYNLIAESNGTVKKLNLVLPDKYRVEGRKSIWPYTYTYAEYGTKPKKWPNSTLPGAQNIDIAIYYVAKDIRMGKYKEGVIFENGKTFCKITPISKTDFEISMKSPRGKYNTSIRSWPDLKDYIPGL